MKTRRSFQYPYGSGRGMRTMDPVLTKAMQDAGWKQVFGTWISPQGYYGGGRFYTMHVEWHRDLLKGSRWIRLAYHDEQGRYQFERILSRADFLEECRN
jgi:hypothetical protein